MPLPVPATTSAQPNHLALLRWYEAEHDPMLIRAVDTVSGPTTYDEYMDTIHVEINQTAVTPDVVTAGHYN